MEYPTAGKSNANNNKKPKSLFILMAIFYTGFKIMTNTGQQKKRPVTSEPTCVDDSHASVVVVRKVRGILSANAGSRNGKFFQASGRIKREPASSRIPVWVQLVWPLRKRPIFEKRILPFGSADFHRINALYQ
ncbi:MAG: hypothetical protein WC527_05805 [Candidatus Margulisiibacteriota bacterium]